MKTTGKPTNNLVLLKPRMLNDKIILKSGKELFIDTAFEKEKHTNVVCDVIQVPTGLIFSEVSGNYITMPWDIDMEIRVGDVAYCDYLAMQNSITNKFDGKSFVDNGELYVLIHYMNIFMVLRDDVPIMCNGYVLIEPTYDEYYKAVSSFNELGLVAPERVNRMKHNTQYGIIRYMGSRPRRYLNPKDKNGNVMKEYSDMEINIGDKVLMDKFADIPLEYEYHTTFEPGKHLCRVLRRDIMMVL